MAGAYIVNSMVPAVASAFLQVAFDRLASPAVVNYFIGSNDGLRKNLIVVLNSADAVLIDAEEKQITNPAVKKWLDDLKDAVYVADDLLDEIATESEFQTGTNSVRDLFSSYSNTFDKRITSELEEILTRLEYIMKQKDVLGLKAFAGEVPLPPRQFTTSCPEEYGVYGRDIDREEIFKKLQSNGASGNEICVVPIVGMGGVGKTTLARFVYNDNRVKDNFDLKAWVCVSENIDCFRIAKTVLEDITFSNCDIQNLNLLQIRIREKLTGKRFLLVLDDVWNENYIAWDELLRVFRCGAQKIKIIATTRSEKVASIVCPFPPHHLKPLSLEECWFLFEKHAFENGNSSEHLGLEVIGREISHKCKGLPLAIKTLGGLLRSKQDPSEWTRILESDIWDLPEGESGIFPALRLSYHYLPSCLKRCFTYCSIFPKDYEFSKEQLVLLWMAEDLLQQSKGNVKKIGEQYFDDLVSRSFFQQSSNNKLFFIMHDLFNDLAKSISGEFSFRLDIDDPSEITIKTRHFSFFTTGFDASRKFGMSYKAKGLRTFLGLKSSFEWSSTIEKITMKVIVDLLDNFKCLRVLALSNYKNIRVPKSIGNLKHLRYLNLSSTSIESLPDSVCNLYNLQTLLLRDCYSLKELPTNMGRLVNLRFLDIRGTNLKEMPLEMGKLRSLQNLSTFFVGKHRKSSIRELGELRHLSGTLSISNLENVHCTKDVMEVNLKEKKYLSELELQWGLGHFSDNSEKERNVLEKLRHHTNLKSLTIRCYYGTRFPNWLGDSSFSNIVSIKLYDCKNCFSLPPLGKLPALKELSIEGFERILSVDSEFYGNGSFATKPFKSLETLTFTGMPLWKEWDTFEGKYEGRVFSTLRELRIIRCPELIRSLPSKLPCLNVLEIRECDQLVASLPKSLDLHELHLKGCDEVQLNKLPPSLRSLTIGGCHTSLPGGGLPTSLKSLEICGILPLPRGHYYPSLESLKVQKGPNSLWSLPLELLPKLKFVKLCNCKNLESLSALEGRHQNLTSLTRLEIRGCPNFVSFPNRGLCALNLTNIEVIDCNKLTSLPEGMHTLLPSLMVLTLLRCPELKSIADGGFPSNLQRLEISYCDELFPSYMKWGLRGLHSLKEFKIGYEGTKVDSFPDEVLLPDSLISFSIITFRHLKSLNGKGFQHLNSLEELSMRWCDKLQCLPEGLPASLSFLYIEDCPMLNQRCQRDDEDWSKIARIPHIEIEKKLISPMP
ncbi:putative disease resistance protein At3g14460 [Quercus robur]|uniref:putative disease resistance protein At3g14460 n=1 Tax=Quercus robur TaxID=38942 RepID=UPI0021638355|nr:putative disease resistance protein At3g14460 [Quercus robur]XP_050278970.1 putative disease resistance protein At3g14460 [Quercus robur]XP_050278971.1 putative disease resistance protein At3g14460 [Quercus robur]